jgi:hypothetical protein
MNFVPTGQGSDSEGHRGHTENGDTRGARAGDTDRIPSPGQDHLPLTFLLSRIPPGTTVSELWEVRELVNQNNTCTVYYKHHDMHFM